ncbi:MAG: PRC-barrel domain-containing protein [Micavibrio sp.]
MLNKILMGASVLAVMAAMPAMAETNMKAKADEAGTKIENTLAEAGQAIENTADKAAAKTKEAYRDVQAYFSDDDDIKSVKTLNMASALTSDQLLGASIENPQGETIGKIDDILVDSDGDAERVIVNDNGFLGLGGKRASFDFDIIEGITGNENIVVRLNEKSIDNARAYDPDAMPAGLYSVNKIKGAKLLDAQGKAIADVDTVVFDGDDADYIIVSFNKILGIGGDKAALDFDALNLVNNGGKYSFKLNAQQTAEFQTRKDSRN